MVGKTYYLFVNFMDENLSTPKTHKKSKDLDWISSLKQEQTLSYRLYTACQVLNGNSQEFYNYKNLEFHKI